MIDVHSRAGLILPEKNMRTIFLQLTAFCGFLAFFHGSILAQDSESSQAENKVNYKAYNNFDFVAGEKILFEDNFEQDMDGEFAAHWKLIAGQATVNTKDGNKYFFLTEGNYAKVCPRMKTSSYLGESFTVELDYLVSADMEGNGILVFLTDASGDDGRSLGISQNEVRTNYFDNDLRAEFPAELTHGWHHISIAYKKGQIKVYVDQTRALVIPDCGFVPVSLEFGGIAPMVFDNVKIADGGGMNMLNKLLTDGKFITHGITFDVNKAVIKPESMGILNDMAKFLKENPSLKVEIGGHTDSDGSADLNQKLSQKRADAVKNQLVSMGVDASRMTAKGYGASKPISGNDTPEGKANNRRVEFTRL